MFVEEYSLKQKIKRNVESKKWCIQFLPTSLETESSIKKISHNGVLLKTSYIIDIIHNLILKYYFKKENLFNLSSLILKEKYGHIYNKYIDYLLEKNILILVKNYRKGKHTKIYSINEKVLTDKITRYKNTDKILLKKYKNNVSMIDERDIESSLIDIDVKRKLVNDLFYTQIQFDKAIYFLDSTMQDVDIYNRNRYSVESISDKQIFYHFDGYGRLHTNFTILKSFIRKNCLLIDSEETLEIDIPNSQPLFLTKILDNFTNMIDKDELSLFKYLTKKGLLYQFILDNSQLNGKKSAKEMIYKVFFGKNYRNKYDNIFMSLFPSIHNFIKIYKKENKNYRILAHELQNLESNLIFNKIVKEIMYVYPEIKVITVHDSIIYPAKWKEVIEKIFSRNLENEFKN